MRTDSPWEVAIVYRLVRRRRRSSERTERKKERKREKKETSSSRENPRRNGSLSWGFIWALYVDLSWARARPPREEGTREEKEGEERVLCSIRCGIRYFTRKVERGRVNVGSLICAQELSRWRGFGRRAIADPDRHSVLIDATRKLSLARYSQSPVIDKRR